jgi:hypothetical protein
MRRSSHDIPLTKGGGCHKANYDPLVPKETSRFAAAVPKPEFANEESYKLTPSLSKVKKVPVEGCITVPALGFFD